MNITLERYAKPIEPICDTDRRALVSEVAIGLVRNAQATDSLELSVDEFAILTNTAESRIAALSSNASLEYDPLREIEAEEAIRIAEQLKAGCDQFDGDPIADPQFPGCGFVNACFGDFLSGSTLIEVKTVVRRFKNTDVRQGLVYCALNHGGGTKYCINRLALLNPRQGVYFVDDLDAIAENVSGVSFDELANRMLDTFTSYELSK